MSKTIYHHHHIIPKHMGGTDDPSNIVKLTIEEHAEAHRKLYEEHGRWQDRIAWLGLAGQIGREELVHEIQRASALKRYEDPEERRKQSERMKGHECKPETRKKISDAHRGRVHSSPIHGGRSPNNTSQIANRECCGKFWTAPCLAIHKSQFHSDPDDSHPGNILHQSKYRDYIKSLWSSTARWGRFTIARQLPKVFPELFGDQRLVEKVEVIIREFRREQRS